MLVTPVRDIKISQNVMGRFHSIFMGLVSVPAEEILNIIAGFNMHENSANKVYGFVVSVTA